MFQRRHIPSTYVLKISNYLLSLLGFLDSCFFCELPRFDTFLQIGRSAEAYTVPLWNIHDFAVSEVSSLSGFRLADFPDTKIFYCDILSFHQILYLYSRGRQVNSGMLYGLVYVVLCCMHECGKTTRTSVYL